MIDRNLLEPVTVRFPDRRHREVMLSKRGITAVEPMKLASEDIEDALIAIENARMHLGMCARMFKECGQLAYSLDLVADMIRSYGYLLEDDFSQIVSELYTDSDFATVVDDDPLGEVPVDDRIPPRYVSGD